MKFGWIQMLATALLTIGVVEVSFALRRRDELTRAWSRQDFFHRVASYSEYNARQLLSEGVFGIVVAVAIFALSD